MNKSEFEQQFTAHFERHTALVQTCLATLGAPLHAAACCIIEALRDGHKLLLCGNGGSAADAQHIAAELTGRYLVERRGLPAIALTTDSSALTAISNDYGFEQVFARQVQALAHSGDVLLGISTSGNSANVIAAVKMARTMGVTSIGLLGHDGGQLGQLVDIPLIIPSPATPHIQELHIMLGHLLCGLVDQALLAFNTTESSLIGD